MEAGCVELVGAINALNIYPWRDKGYTKYQFTQTNFYNTIVRRMSRGFVSHYLMNPYSGYLCGWYKDMQDLRSMNE